MKPILEIILPHHYLRIEIEQNKKLSNNWKSGWHRSFILKIIFHMINLEIEVIFHYFEINVSIDQTLKPYLYDISESTSLMVASCFSPGLTVNPSIL